jgi:hypothetical protein
MLETPSQPEMGDHGTVGKLDKRKACVFLILVAVALVCLCLLVYALMYAKPTTNPTIKNGGNSMIRQTVPPGPRLLPMESTVHS